MDNILLFYYDKAETDILLNNKVSKIQNVSGVNQIIQID